MSAESVDGEDGRKQDGSICQSPVAVDGSIEMLPASLEGADEHEAAPPTLEPEEIQQEALEELDEAAAPDLGAAEVVRNEEPTPGSSKAKGLTGLTIMIGSKKLRLKVVPAPPKIATKKRPDIASLISMDYFDENPYVCSYCGRNYSSRVKLLRHETEHTGRKPYSCNYCGKGFTHRQSLIMHERIHTGEKPFQCPICTKCFARQTNYNIHMKLHASGRRYFCSFCGKWYRTEHEMLDHQQNCLAQMNGQPVATDKPLRYQCNYCEKMFHHRRDKNIHERTHTGERPYTCGYCGKGFTQSQALTIHIRTHTGERPYMCSICNKDFRDSSALRKHEFVKHTNNRTHAMALYGDLHADAPSPLIMTEDQLDAAVFSVASA